MRQWIANITLVFISSIIAVLICEIFLQYTRESPKFFLDQKVPNGYELDEELGHKPKFNNITYDLNGLVIEKNPNIEIRKSILFIGDSVTRRGKITGAISDTCDGRYNILNGGIESYNIFQIVRYFQRYTIKSLPQEIVLLLHPNDFDIYPTLFQNSAGRVFATFPGEKAIEINLWLYRNSILYQFYKSLFLPKLDEEMRLAIGKELIKELIDFTDQRKINLNIVTLPSFKKIEEWTEKEKRIDDSMNKILSELSTCYYSGYSALKKTISADLEIQETKGDSWHPSQQYADILAQELIKHPKADDSCFGFLTTCRKQMPPEQEE